MRNRRTHSNANKIENGLMGRAGRLVASFRQGLGNGAEQPALQAWTEDSLRHLSSLLDSVTTAIVSLDGKGRVRVFNAAAEKMFGLPRAQVVGLSVADIGRTMSETLDDRAPFWERLSDATWAAGAAIDLEFDLLQKSGVRRVISYSVYPLGRMAWSVGNGVVIMLEDITRRKEMEEQASEARKRLLSVFDGITDGIQVVDPEFRITAVNKSMTVLLGKDILIGGRCFESCMPSGRKCEDCPAEETFRTGQPASVMRRLPPLNPGEPERHFEINTFPQLDRGNRVVQVVEYIKDVTEKVLLAERLEHARRLAELGEMAARVAHEVRNPLNAITGAAHFLSKEYTHDTTLQKFTSLIKRQAVRVNQVASDLLYLSKPLGSRFSTVNVNAVLDQALDSLCEPARDRGITIISERTADLPELQADELQLEQAFHNVLRNAVEAMPGGGTLRLRTSATAEAIQVGIRDSGHGIAAEDRKKIFQSFFTTKTKGTGLGLTIVQRVLKNHAGSITIEHPQEGGTLVVLSLPLRTGGEAAGHSAQSASGSGMFPTPS